MPESSPHRTRVKICGITRPDDARVAATAGVDAIGLVFYPPSPRAVNVEQAQEVIDVLPPFLTTVALFVDPSDAEVERVLDRLPIDMLQFHGDESATFCDRFGRCYLKAVRMRDGVDLIAIADAYAGAAGLLLDSYRHGVPGGTGHVFDWMRVPGDLEKPIIVAGGLTADNVGQAITHLRPYAVDVSSGVEARKGIKDAARIAAFMQQVQKVTA